MTIGPLPPINLTSPTQTTRPQALSYYASLLQQSYGSSIAQSFLKYANAHPNLTAYDALQNWASFIAAHLGPGLAQAIKSFVQEQGNITKQFAQAPAGLGQVTQDWQHLLLRLAEFGIGGILITVGLIAILRKTEAGQQTESLAKTAAKVVK